MLTDACTTLETPPRHLREALANVHPEVRNHYYGCGVVAPAAASGAKVLDLGSGSGQDAFVIAQLVGPLGRVVGVDATPEQLDIARDHVGWHSQRFGFDNVDFLEGDIEKLDALDLEPGSFDVIISNCVINLVTDKAKIFADAYRLLKPGGEFYFSDIYADRRIPTAFRSDPVLHGECLAGALYWRDFLTMARDAGFGDPRLVTDRPLALLDEIIVEKLAGFSFFSAAYRLLKVEGLEPAREDYGQSVMYLGTIPGDEAELRFDKSYRFEARRSHPVDGNTWRMLNESRYAPHFEFVGDFTTHFGQHDAADEPFPFDRAQKAVFSSCC